MRSGDAAIKALDSLIEHDPVNWNNASFVRRAIAFSSCQQSAAVTPEPASAYGPTRAITSVEERRLLKIGPALGLSTPGQASAVARDGDIIEITAGIYEGDAAIWNA